MLRVECKIKAEYVHLCILSKSIIIIMVTDLKILIKMMIFDRVMRFEGSIEDLNILKGRTMEGPEF